uniref:Uncharacterized protein n=1 Tax=Kalanchoe fedtschenkoi TaxID=63787 RepID=A0A7N0SYF5_KALFE
MAEKGTTVSSSVKWMLVSNPLLHWRCGILVMTVCLGLGMAVVLTINGSAISSFVDGWNYKRESMLAPARPDSDVSVHRDRSNLTDEADAAARGGKPSAKAMDPPQEAAKNETREDSYCPDSDSSAHSPSWISTELETDVSANLLQQWLLPGGTPCRDLRTVEIALPSFDNATGGKMVELATGELHEFIFQALDESGNPRCSGGDYFEADLSSETWKSRPPVTDLKNGSYSLKLQVHQDFAGVFNFSITLLFRHFEGLKFSPARFVFDRQLRNLNIRFFQTQTQTRLPNLQLCSKSDFNRSLWSGRWTRHGRNDQCKISNDGRYRCLDPSFQCQRPWCDGALGLIESNGWVYSAHCSFKIFSSESAWSCLNGRWLFFWGDSNHVDSIRNLLHFILLVPDLEIVSRRFDANFSNPRNPSQHLRITNVFNGHWNSTGNYLGIDSLRNAGYRELIRSYFSGDRVPDAVVMNSGLHDGVYWKNVKRFVAGADYAASFWAKVMQEVASRGLKRPEVIYRTTVATGGYARALAFNPNKMEAFNWILVEKLRKAGLVDGVIDGFDMTFPWHWDNRCNDGVHYGRFPAKAKWRDGGIGHQYFVDLMLVHVWLNVLCAR